MTRPGSQIRGRQSSSSSPNHPRTGEQFTTADDRAFRVETVEHYFDPEGNCVHLFCTEFPRVTALRLERLFRG